MAKAMPTVSVVIRTLNEEERLGTLLESLGRQAGLESGLEIIVVDSGSTDGTLDIVGEHGATLVRIAREEFNYSKALNLGIERSRGELVTILSGHSVPASQTWLCRVVRHFADAKVAGVYCRQKPWEDAGHHERRRIMALFGEQSRVYSSFNHEAIPFSNAASCVRRSVWERHRFVVLPAAEDSEWAQWALTHGYKIIYDALAAVYHSHNDCARKAARRLIEIEQNTDMQIRRRRTQLFTIVQGLKWLGNLARSDMAADGGISHRMQMVAEDAKCIFWYIADFKD